MASGFVNPQGFRSALAPTSDPWLISALGRDANRFISMLTSGFMAPANALAGNYDQRTIDQSGAVSPVDPRMVSDANNMAGMVSLGAPGMVPEGALGMGIKAYHGSPHSFDKFDMSKIGTGEGAQAYGHGLYFAENEGVAKGYQAQLTPPPTMTPEVKTALRSLDYLGFDSASQAIAAVRQHPDWASRWDVDPKSPEAASISQYVATPVNRGATYAVDINAHPDQFLDWDKPLSEQSPVVQDGIRTAIGALDPASQDYFSKNWNAIKGEQAYRELYGAPDASGKLDTAASMALRKAGISGIKYLDQGSRNASMGWRILSPQDSTSGKWVVGNAPNGPNKYFTNEGEARDYFNAQRQNDTRNYVLFDDNLVNIEKKYGVLGGVPNTPTPQIPLPPLMKLNA